MATLREMTLAERQDRNNMDMKGVRTFYFQAHHYRGLPEFNFENTDYEDFAWVPKRQLNEYFDREYYDIFIKGTFTR